MILPDLPADVQRLVFFVNRANELQEKHTLLESRLQTILVENERLRRDNTNLRAALESGEDDGA